MDNVSLQMCLISFSDSSHVSFLELSGTPKNTKFDRRLLFSRSSNLASNLNSLSSTCATRVSSTFVFEITPSILFSRSACLSSMPVSFAKTVACPDCNSKSMLSIFPNCSVSALDMGPGFDSTSPAKRSNASVNKRQESKNRNVNPSITPTPKR
ncbi:hypothetical protein ISCGN_021491 [Ixodes scapularis]